MDEYDHRKINRIVVLLDELELGVLNILAKDLGLSSSSYVRQLIRREYLERYGSKD